MRNVSFNLRNCTNDTMNMAIQGKVVRALHPYLVPDIEEADDLPSFKTQSFTTTITQSLHSNSNQCFTWRENCHLTKIPRWQKH